jgi:hypothetical protein
MKLVFLLITISVVGVILLYQLGGRIDNIIFFGGDFILLLGLLFLAYKQFSLKNKLMGLSSDTDVSQLEINEYEKKKHLLRRTIILFPLILIFPALLLGVAYLTSSEDGLAAIVLLIGSAFIVAVIEIVLVLLYVFKFSEKRTSYLPNVQENYPLNQINIEFIDKIILFFTIAYFIGYIVMFTYDGLTFITLPSIVMVGYVVSVTMLYIAKKKIALNFLNVALASSLLMALVVTFDYQSLFGRGGGSPLVPSDGDSLSGIVTILTAYSGFVLSIFCYVRLRKYCRMD